MSKRTILFFITSYIVFILVMRKIIIYYFSVYYFKNRSNKTRLFFFLLVHLVDSLFNYLEFRRPVNPITFICITSLNMKSSLSHFPSLTDDDKCTSDKTSFSLSIVITEMFILTQLLTYFLFGS